PGDRVILVLLAAGPPPPAPEAATDAGGGTPARGRGASEAKSRSGRTGDEPTLEQAIDTVLRAGVTLQVVTLGAETGDEPFAALRRASEQTGGEYLIASEPADVDSACRRIAEAFLHRYSIGYAPDKGRPGWHSIDLKLRRPDAQITARKGYSSDQK
ncbi:MAG TPA: hypothetical protein VFT43_13855, partial [Candidatus Polarisedimenticolia bacterium]|nr:hypothetical protein [Candidatus Polarisedimenticolia bacterium]